MEEIELRDALRQHVFGNEPPMGLNAHDLMATGRRQHRWRALAIGSGSATTAAVLVGAFVLVPGAGNAPWSSDRSCPSLPIEVGWSPQPFLPPDQPQITVNPTALPSGDPSPLPSNDPSPQPSDVASNYPSYHATPEPTGLASDLPLVVPSNLGGSDSPTPVPATVQPVRVADRLVRDAECYLRSELVRLLPEATFASTMDGVGPLVMYTGFRYGASGKADAVVYSASTAIIVDGRSFHFTLTISPGRGTRPVGAPPGWGFEQGDTYTVRYFDDGRVPIVETYAPHSDLLLVSTGSLLKIEQLADLLRAPELDLFKP